MANTHETPDFAAMAEAIFQGLPAEVATKAVDFFKMSFVKEGFTDYAFISWPARKGGETHRILTKSSTLKDSIKVASATMDRVEIESGKGIPYAAIHNNGGTISVPVTKKSRKFFWYMYKQTGKDKWKYMALTKKSHLSITIPQRQYIGQSEQLLSEINDLIIKRIQAAQAKL